METTFYEDFRYRRDPEPRPTKRPATLDLDGVRSGKKLRGASSLLTSPDLHMLKLESPELEKLIIQQHGLQQQCMYPSKTDDRGDVQQQHYSRDFPDALSALPNASSMHLYAPPDLPQTSMVDTSNGYYHHHQQQPLSSININCNPMVSSAMSCYAPGGGYYGTEPLVNVKEEPQTVPSCAGGPCSPPRSPIDMEDQERLKLERKRLRNRIAASKCRRRKLERIARLEDKVSHLKNENAELSGHVTRLREHVCQLKQQVMEHVRSGCEILVSSGYPASYDNL